MSKSTEQVGDLDVEFDIKPLLDGSEDNVFGECNFYIDIEQSDGSIDPAHIKAKYVVCGSKRYILFEAIKPNNTVIGNLQRRIARMSNLRLVDRKLLNDTIKEVKDNQSE